MRQMTGWIARCSQAPGQKIQMPAVAAVAAVAAVVLTEEQTRTQRMRLAAERVLD